jgi:7-cyano-7-deazaguanine synthase
MCGIVGIVARTPVTDVVRKAFEANNARGRDSWGFWTPADSFRATIGFPGYDDENDDAWMGTKDVLIANMRAEPTTEFVLRKDKTDVQPYEYGDWVVVHNGTIANDKQLVAEHNLAPNTRIDSWVIAPMLHTYGFLQGIQKLVGSYAIIAINKTLPDRIYFAMNYRPLYKHIDDIGSVVLSSVPLSDNDALLPAYSYGCIIRREREIEVELFPGGIYNLIRRENRGKKALVVHSGGLDSTVAATKLVRDGYDVTLLHFAYGARAQGPEERAVLNVSAALGVPHLIVTTPIFTDVIKGSRLTNTKEDNFAEGEAGAEYAHEWVPARNLILSSIAIGIAESRGFDYIALGANLEEAGAYPDNEPEFLRQLQKLMPYAVSDGKQITILTPVGNLMKHEIVKLGLQINAPMDMSWSCYDAATAPVGNTEYRAWQHCGKCGPCYMRRVAFEINGRVDPVFAAVEA